MPGRNTTSATASDTHGGHDVSWRPSGDARDAEALERQHDKLIALMGQLAESGRGGASKRELADLLDDLCTLTRQHFAVEEDCMYAAGYPRADIHALIHRKLMSKLLEHTHAFRAGNGKLACELLSFLEFWLAAHVRGVDQHYVRHVASRAPAKPER